jgi:hypothetical protein
MVDALRLMAGSIGILAALIQMALAARWYIWLFATMFMAGDNLSSLQFTLLHLLPICTLVGAFLAFRLPATGGTLMLATAAGYFVQLPFERLGLLSAIPGAIGVSAGLLLWLKRNPTSQL